MLAFAELSKAIDISSDIDQEVRQLVVDKAKIALKNYGVDKFTESRLNQLRTALYHPYSTWFNHSEHCKKEIFSAIQDLIGDEKLLIPSKAKKKRVNKPVATQDFSYIQCDPKLKEILINYFPLRPWCADSSGFVDNRPRRLDVALRKKYIQYNPPNFMSFIVVDIDRRVNHDEWSNVGLPQPTWAAINPVNGHAHFAWVVESPVWAGGGNQKPASYFKAIQEAFTATLGGDEGFVHTLTKNPINEAWNTYSPSGYSKYNLKYLAKFVDLKKNKPKNEQLKVESIGRNCMLFDEVRVWSYLQVKKYDDSLSFGSQVQAHIESLNKRLQNPMSNNEIFSIGRSITRWTWGRRNCFQDPSERARDCQKKSAEVRRTNSQEKRAKANILRKNGCTHKNIALELKISTKTVQRWLA